MSWSFCILWNTTYRATVGGGRYVNTDSSVHGGSHKAFVYTFLALRPEYNVYTLVALWNCSVIWLSCTGFTRKCEMENWAVFSSIWSMQTGCLFFFNAPLLLEFIYCFYWITLNYSSFQSILPLKVQSVGILHVVLCSWGLFLKCKCVQCRIHVYLSISCLVLLTSILNCSNVTFKLIKNLLKHTTHKGGRLWNERPRTEELGEIILCWQRGGFRRKSLWGGKQITEDHEWKVWEKLCRMYEMMCKWSALQKGPLMGRKKRRKKESEVPQWYLTTTEPHGL